MAQSEAPLRTYSKPDEASVGELAARLSEQVSRLVHDEFALAAAEAKEKAKRLGIGAGMFGVSGALAMFGAACGVATIVLALAMEMSAWLAALIVSVALFLGAGVFALAGRRGVRRGSPPVPTEALRSTKEDVAAVREAVRQ
jgi:uncharacterized membrane protein YqjE